MATGHRRRMRGWLQSQRPHGVVRCEIKGGMALGLALASHCYLPLGLRLPKATPPTAILPLPCTEGSESGAPAVGREEAEGCPDSSRGD